MNPRLCKRQDGTSLLEALIAIVVLAFGMLGVAGLNLASLKATQEGGNRNAAALLTQEIADKLRTTHAGERTLALRAGGTAALDSAAILPMCYDGNCSAAAQIRYELIGWAKSIDDAGEPDALVRARASRLPGGRGAVCFDDTPDDGTPEAPACSNNPLHPIAVKLWWNERPGNASSATVQQVRYIASFVL